MPAVSDAATLTFDDARAVYHAEARERNHLTVEPRSGTPMLEFTEGGGQITVFGEIPGLGEDPCSRLLFNKVQCYPMPLQVRLGSGSDVAHVVVNSKAEVWGGGGNDNLLADSNGGSTRLYGEGGDDTLAAGGEGGQVADGGPGNDTVRCCGFAGGGTMRGGSGDDRMTFFTNLSAIADIHGGPGSDTIVASAAGSPGTVAAGDGNDDITIIDGGAAYWPIGHTGSYTVDAGDGNDTIRGGPYDDTIDAGSGPDRVHAAEGGVDVVTCGAGADTVTADEHDHIADDCEVRIAPDA